MLYIWLGVIVALLMVEFLSKNFTAICFAISAILSLIFANTTTNNYITQVTIFLVGGIVLMVFVRPNVMNLVKDLKEKKKKTQKANKKTEEKIETNDEDLKSQKEVKKTNKKINKKKNANK